MEDHVFQKDFAGILHAERDHGETVSHQDDIDPRLVCDMSGWEVVGGDHSNWLALTIECLQSLERDFFASWRIRATHRRVGAIAGLRSWVSFEQIGIST